jgi:prepilin-type N-terminal cleavage/methylation domain-containing protein/prepilin-type processing-associated H-X9-DG protein
MKKNGFTLIELLVVIAIIALLLGILMPSLARARSTGKQVVCFSNLRQMGMAAGTYVADNAGRFPLAQLVKVGGGVQHEMNWDFQKTMQSGLVTEHSAGLLWQGDSSIGIQQCPMFKGAANSEGDEHSGYNYNSSFIGGMYSTDYMTGALVGINSAKEGQIRQPGDCAVFGDGQYSNGANKFMRSPFVGKLDVGLAGLRPYGTQGFRHSGNTNVAYADGSVAVVKKRCVETYGSLKDKIAEDTGFLSDDNRAYDLR